MSKITLTNLADLNNQNSVVTNINNNNTTLVNAFDNTLSRDGTSPNQMESNLDMNSYKIINLAAPTNNTDAVRFQDIGDAVAASVAADASAAAADASATAAATSATNASNSATAAASSATSASNSATTATSAAATASASYAGIRFTYDTSTSMANPGTGNIRFNNATLSSATAVAMSYNSADSGNPAINAYVLTWDDSTNTSNKGNFILRKLGTPGTYAVFNISSVTDNSTWLQLAVTYVGGNGSWTASDNMSLDFNRSGDKGVDGALSGPGVSVDSEIALFSGTSGTTLKRATQTGILKGTSGVIGTASAGTDYAAPGANTDITSVLLSNTGLKVKDVGGSFNLDFKPGSTLTANRTLTVTTGDSDRTLTLGGNATVSQDYSTTGNPQFATIELGNASDTTLSRSSAGVLAVEGVTVPLNSTSATHTAGTVELGNASDTTLSRASAGTLAVEGVNVLTTGTGAAQGKQTIWVPSQAMIPRTTNGPSIGTVEMSTNKNMFKTLDYDTTTQEFAQFEIAMPKSWNNSTITFQPVWSHAATTTNFGVVWALQAVFNADNSAGDVAFGTEQTSTDTGGTTNNIYVGPESSAITVSGSPAAGGLVQFQIKRNPSDGSDTMAIDARLHGIKVYFTTNLSTDA